jgi:hypothetical protein
MPTGQLLLLQARYCWQPIAIMAPSGYGYSIRAQGKKFALNVGDTDIMAFDRDRGHPAWFKLVNLEDFDKV